MKLPWKNQKLEEEKETLEEKIEEQENQIEKLENMLEAEKDRRSNLAREKQEAEEKLNRLKDKVEGLKDNSNNEEKSSVLEFRDVNFQKFQNSLEKLGSLKSPEKDMVSIYSPERLSNHSELSDIKNSLPEEKLRPLLNEEKISVFYTENLGIFCFKLRPFFHEKFSTGRKFELEGLKEFVKNDKHWALISRGESKIYAEKNGGFEEIDMIKDRVNSQHGKGGFSQARFERKRNEQVQKHLENVNEEIEGLENIYLLGDKTLCKDLSGEYLGGFDPNSSPLENFYRPRRLKTSSLEK
jgi:predicted  nucleic acid-binding Zn-ribbon protein